MQFWDCYTTYVIGKVGKNRRKTVFLFKPKLQFNFRTFTYWVTAFASTELRWILCVVVLTIVAEKCFFK